MSGRVRLGICAFAPPPSFRDVLPILKRHVDDIYIVYGRWKHFDLPYVDPPKYLEEHSTLILSDHKLPQHEQRDLYLEGLETGDYLFMFDTDFIPSDYKGFRKIQKMDAESFSIAYFDDVRRAGILAYRFKEGWKHGTGQMLQDQEGKMICRPYHNVLEVGDGVLFYHHDLIKNSNPEYKEAYLKYWEAVRQ